MGKIQAVTNENVAEYVAERKALGSEVKSPEQVKADETAAPDKTIDSKPAEQSKTESDKGKSKNSFQDRIDELVRKAKEADEFAEDTYGQLTLTQRRVKELEEQLQVTNQPPKPEKKPEPKPANYLKEDGTVDQDKFLADWGKWNRDTAIEEFEAKRAEDIRKAEETRLMQEAEARRIASLEAARKEFPDFDEKIEEARVGVETKRRESPNRAVESLIWESDYQAHILYHLVDHPEEVSRLNKMRPSQAAIAIGRLETKFAKPVEANTGTPVITPKPNLPEPTPSLGAGGGAIPVDIAGPMDFKAYKAKRVAELQKHRKR